MLKLQVNPEAAIAIPESPSLADDEPTAIPLIVMFHSTMSTLPTSGIFTALSIRGNWSETIEEIALVVSKSLRKSSPCWEITTDVNAWSVNWRRVCAGMKNEAIRSTRIVGVAMEVDGFLQRTLASLLAQTKNQKIQSFKLKQNSQ